MNRAVFRKKIVILFKFVPVLEFDEYLDLLERGDSVLSSMHGEDCMDVLCCKKEELHRKRAFEEIGSTFGKC